MEHVFGVITVHDAGRVLEILTSACVHVCELGCSQVPFLDGINPLLTSLVPGSADDLVRPDPPDGARHRRSGICMCTF